MSSSDLASIPTRRPRLILLIFALAAAAAAYGLTRLHEEEDLLVFLPTHDPDVQLFQEVSRRFGGLRVALIGVEAPAGQDVFTTDAVARITAATNAIRNTRGVDRVVSMTSLPDVIAGPAGAEVTQLVAHPPANAAEQQALRAKVLSRETAAGSFVSRDGRSALIMVFLAEGVGDRALTAELRNVAEAQLRPYDLYYGGAPFAGINIYEEAQSDVWKLSPIALAVLLLVVVWSFRDPVGVLLTIASVAVSVLFVLGGMGLLGEKFTVASSTLPVILFASGSSYAVHVLGRYYLVRKNAPADESVRQALRITGPPLLIAAATTSVGFFSFVATDVRPMRVFGIACGTGVLLCWITSLTLVPAVMTLWPRPATTARQLASLGNGMVALWNWARRHRVIVIGASLAGYALLAAPMMRVTVRMEPRAFFRVGSEPWRAEKFLEEQFGGAHFVQIALKGDLDDPATLREAQRLVDYTRSLDGVTQVQSILDAVRLVNDAMGGGQRLPQTSAQAANLYFFLEGEAGMQALLAPGRKEALLHVRVRGDARPVVAELEKFVTHELRAHPPMPSPSDVAERVAWAVRASQHREIDRAAVERTTRVVAAPGDRDPEWTQKRTELTRAYLTGDEAPPLSAAARDEVVKLMTEGSPDARVKLIAASPSPEEGGLAWAGLSGRLDVERRDLAVARALGPIAMAAGARSADGPIDPALRSRLAAILDDLFLPRDAAAATPAATAFTARIAGEPILDRGFSRSVERNQIRSGIVAVVAVLLLLLALFRSARLALICMAPSMLAMIAIFGVMGLEGVPIDLGTSLVAGICTGAGSDFAMHYIWYLQREPADQVTRTVGPVMSVSVLLVALGFVVLALGRSPVMRLFGNLAGLSMALSAVLTCLLVPALLNKVRTE